MTETGTEQKRVVSQGGTELA